MCAEPDHRASMKEASELLVKALHERQVMDEEMKKSQSILQGQRQDRKLYADLACKYDLRLAWVFSCTMSTWTYTWLGSDCLTEQSSAWVHQSGHSWMPRACTSCRAC